MVWVNMCTAYGFAKSLKDYLHWFPFVGAHAVSVAWSNEVRQWELCLLQSRLTMGLFRLLYIAGRQRPVKIDELRHATTIWTPGDLPHRHWPSYRTKTICFVLVMVIYLIYVGRVLPVHNQLLDGYTRPHLHSTSPKDGWTGPWMRRCMDHIQHQEFSRIKRAIANHEYTTKSKLYLVLQKNKYIPGMAICHVGWVFHRIEGVTYEWPWQGERGKVVWDSSTDQPMTGCWSYLASDRRLILVEL